MFRVQIEGYTGIIENQMERMETEMEATLYRVI